MLMRWRMCGVVKIDITKSIETLKTLLIQQKTAFGKERIQALYLLKTRQAETVQHLAVILGRNRVTVQRWLRQYRIGGLPKLLEVRKSKGRPMVIPKQAIACLEKELKDPEGFSSYGEVQTWLYAELGIKANYHVVHNLVRYKLKSKLKVPRPKSDVQNLEELESFKKNS